VRPNLASPFRLATHVFRLRHRQPSQLGGHATFDSTYYYVHTSPDFMAAYADITRQRQSLLPQVGF